MGFFIKDGTRVWCGDLRWKQYPRKPSFRKIRHDAVAMGMTHFVRTARLPNRIGYLRLDRTGEKIRPDSLLLSVAEHFGAEYLGEYQVAPDQHWLIATDEAGIPLIGSDGIYTADEIDAVKTSFAGHVFTRKAVLSEDEFAALQKELPAAPVSLRSISLRPFCLGAVAIGASVLVIMQAAHVVQQRRLEAVRLAAQRALRQSAHAVKPPPPIVPGDWVRTCLQAARSFPVFANGWTMGHWDCNDHTLTISWRRSGGTLATAPAGEIQDIGNTVISRVHLDIPATDPRQPPPTQGDRQFLALIQGAGAALTTGTPAKDASRQTSGTRAQTLAVNITWQSDPQTIPWNDFRGVHVTQMSRTVTAEGRSGSGNVATDGYQLQVTLDSSAEPPPRH